MIVSIRTAYHKIRTEKQLEQFIKKFHGIDAEEAQPYLASAIMQKAQYAFLPTSKLKYFKQGKKQLESFIQNNPNNLEARYVRVLVQSNVPEILGYKNNIKSDIEFIKSHIKASKLPADYQKVMLTHIKNVTK